MSGYGFEWEKSLIESYGLKTATFLTEKIIRLMGEVESSEYSNVRVAEVGNDLEENLYEKKVSSSEKREDVVVFYRVTGKEYRIGFDYI